MERARQAELRRQFDLVAKVSLVNNMKVRGLRHQRRERERERETVGLGISTFSRTFVHRYFPST